MALEVKSPVYEDIIKLARITKPKEILENMSFKELELLNHQISGIIFEMDEDKKLHENLMRLRSYIVLSMWSA